MSDILLGVIVFSSVILFLVIILNVLGNILLPQGEVTLLIKIRLLSITSEYRWQIKWKK